MVRSVGFGVQLSVCFFCSDIDDEFVVVAQLKFEDKYW